ncbi:MAG: DUF4012 domain-containing protein [Candidatus Blackburnbacteria bacterium]|nr:DUF4012 domain-containing protein [Candidatus Blackburnbacteria bacterium]
MAKIEDMPKIDFSAPLPQPAPVLPSRRFFSKKIALPVLGAVGLLALLLIFFLVLPVLSIRVSAQKLASSARELETAASSQNLTQAQNALNKTKKDLNTLDGDINRLVWVKLIPGLGNYWADAKHLTVGGKAGLEAGDTVIQAIEPYSDILGLNGGKQAEDGTKTAEDRINFIVGTIDGLIPQMDTISQKTTVASSEISKIDPNRYPEYFQGKPVRATVKKAIEAVQKAHEVLSDGKPFLEQLPYILGTKNERTYLILWQNDKELRPTGGFITAYSIVKVNKGKFEPVVSDDIYQLDKKFNSKIPAPEPIKKYLPLVPYWNLRDMNLSPDFKTSMDTFYQNYSTIKNATPIDGIISVDTYPLVGLLKVMGQLGVSGFGNYSADNDSRCNCPNVIYQLESYADVAGPIVWDDISGKIVYKPPHADNRKAFLGPLMNTLVANAMGQPKDKLSGLFQVGWDSLTQKHVLFYMRDPQVQKAVESFNVAGRIQDTTGDFLAINDTNFAGAKSNLYVQENVTLNVEQSKTGSTNSLTIKYSNPQKYDGWLNGPYRDWIRVYVPAGSALVDSTGSDVPVTTSQDLGKTVFEGFFTLRPMGVTELHFKYKTPFVQKKGYKVLIQKQPGTEGHQYEVKFGKQKESFTLSSDKELSF